MLRYDRVICVLLALGWGATAFAQSEERVQDAVVVEEAGKARNGPALRLADLDDSALRSDAYRALVREKRHESIEFLKWITIGDHIYGEQRAEMYLRLAEVYIEEARDLAYIEARRVLETTAVCARTEGCDPSTMREELTEDSQASRVWYKKGIALLNLIAQNYPQYARSDEVAFELGRALQELGQREGAVNLFLSVARLYPESRYVPEAYLRLGEYFSDTGNSTQALDAYQHAASFPDADLYAFALYRLAWAYFAVGDKDHAVETMNAALALPAPKDDTVAVRRLSLVQAEARQELIRFNTDNFFAPANISDLAIFNDNCPCDSNDTNQCIRHYRQAIAQAPWSVTAPQTLGALIAILQQTGDDDAAMDAIDTLQSIYGRHSAWAGLNADHADAIEGATQLVGPALTAQLTSFAADRTRCTDTDDGEACARAIRLATAYVAEFPDDETSASLQRSVAELRFSLAEQLFTAARYAGAYDQYMLLAKEKPPGPESRISARAAVVAAQKLVEAEAGTSQNQPTDSRATLTDGEQRLVRAVDQEIYLFPEEARQDKVAAYQVAYLLYRHKQRSQVVDHFIAAIKLDPSAPEALAAATFALDALEKDAEWHELRTFAKYIVAQQGLGDEALKDRAYALYERASFETLPSGRVRRYELYRTTRDYRAFYEEFPAGPFSADALKAVARYERRAGHLKEASKARRLLAAKPR